jgi:carbon storage regulator
VLVLTRRSGESIVIGHDVVVTVLEVRSDQVRIGIDAPRSVQVHREEVFRQVARENAAAVASADRARSVLGRLPNRTGAAQRPGRGPSRMPLDTQRAVVFRPPGPRPTER